MRDSFSYSARSISIGLDCSCCIHEAHISWLGLNGIYRCTLHDLTLAKLLDERGYKEGEWFCSSFESNGEANETAVSEYSEVRHELNPRILYGGYRGDGLLKEVPFTDFGQRRLTRRCSGRG